jgi:hypothetical protein
VNKEFRLSYKEDSYEYPEFPLSYKKDSYEYPESRLSYKEDSYEYPEFPLSYKKDSYEYPLYSFCCVPFKMGVGKEFKIRNIFFYVEFTL